MADLNSTAVAAAGTAAGMITVTGGAFGMHFDTLIIGFLAGLAALSFQEKETYWRMLASVFSASILAGCFAPVWVAVTLHYLPFLASIGPDAANVASAAAIGGLAQAVAPAMLARLRSLASNLKIGGEQ